MVSKYITIPYACPRLNTLTYGTVKEVLVNLDEETNTFTNVICDYLENTEFEKPYCDIERKSNLCILSGNSWKKLY